MLVEARRPTPESRIWDRDLKTQQKHAKEGLRALRLLVAGDLADAFTRIKAEFPSRSKDHIKKRDRLTLRAVQNHPDVGALLDRFVGADPTDTKVASRKKTVISWVRHILTGKESARTTWAKIEKILAQGYETVTLEREQAALKSSIPPDLRAFLPKKLTIAVDESGNIKEMTDRFVNQYETFKVKRLRQKALLQRLNKIASLVRKDLKSGDPATRMAAVVTAIVMETGIRPGRHGNSVPMEFDGEEIEVETFGASTLQMSHVNIIRDNFAHIEFIGKMGTTNRAELTDASVIKVLKGYIKKARADFGAAGAAGKVRAPLFVAPDGTEFGYGDVVNYFNNRTVLSGLNLNDFRKLKSTRVLLETLKAQQEELLARIRTFIQEETQDLRERIVEAIKDAVEAAYRGAQHALSHGSMTTTVEKYINPEVLLNYLSTGTVANQLEDVVLRGQTRLSFNVEAFIQRAGAARPSRPPKKTIHRRR